MAQSALNRITAFVISGLIILTMIIGYWNFTKLWEYDVIIPSQYVTETKWLSDYFPKLHGTRGDTRVYIIDSGVPGATISVMGGTHPDEQSGMMAAIVLVEYIGVETGKLIVIPQCNNSALTHSFPLEATPQYYELVEKDGSIRTIRGGSRGTNPIDYWPDPEVFSHFQTGQKLSGEEVRNLNRAYPGLENGTFTEQVAFAINKMILQEGVDLNIDLHEAWPEYPFINAMGILPNNMDLITDAQFNMELAGVSIRVEATPANFRGLSYRELPEYAKAIAVLAETPGPGIGRIRGITDTKLSIDGKDAFYTKASQLGRTFVPFPEEGWSLSKRVARHLTTVAYVADSYVFLFGKPFAFINMPTYDEVASTPVGYYLNLSPLSNQ